MNDNARVGRAREFVRHLNVLLKSVRLYGLEHSRTGSQRTNAWQALASLLPGENNGGFLLAVTGTQLLADGAPLEAAASERSVAELFVAAGLASVHFSARVTEVDFDHFVRAFAGGGKSGDLLESLKAALGDSPDAPIRVNRVRFVAEDAGQPGQPGTDLPGLLVTQTLGAEAEKLKDWLKDPQKILQLIAAAEGTQKSSAQPGAPSQPQAAAGPMPEEEMMGVMRMLAQMAQMGSPAGGPADAVQVQQQFAALPGGAQASLQQALAAVVSSKLPTDQPQAHVLVRLAEQLAIRHALERFQSGEVRVDSIRETLARMAREVENLRKLLSSHEDKMTRAGMAVEPHAEILDRQFWAQVPEPAKRSVLLSPDAWCIPARNVASFVEQLQSRGEAEAAEAVLRNYATCTRAPETETRRRASLGLVDLAKCYAAAGGDVLAFAISQVGRQVSSEAFPEVQGYLADAFTRLSHEAASQRRYAAVEQVLNQLQNIEDRKPKVMQEMRPRLGIELRIQDFIEDALKGSGMPAGLAPLLRRVPVLAASQAAARFARCTRREECERLVEVVREAGPEALAFLRETLQAGTDTASVSTVGLLSRLEPEFAEQAVSARLGKWDRLLQDALIRQLAFGAAPERAVLLSKWFQQFDPMLQPEVLDEIGMCGDARATPQLLQVAAGELARFDAPYLRIKAIEALGRLREPRAVALLRKIVEAKRMWTWENPHELRLVAAQALVKIDPPWARSGLAGTGLGLEEIELAPPLDPQASAAWSRQRRYPRLMLALSLAAVASTETRKSNLSIKVVNLGGGMATSDQPIGGGTAASLEVRSGLRSIRAEVLVREARREQITFEVVRMNFEERAKLRKLLAGLQTVAV